MGLRPCTLLVRFVLPLVPRDDSLVPAPASCGLLGTVGSGRVQAHWWGFRALGRIQGGEARKSLPSGVNQLAGFQTVEGSGAGMRFNLP